MKDPHERTNEYLEYLAGRRRTPPPLADQDRDVVQAARLLKSLKTEQPHPSFFTLLRKHVMNPSTPSKQTINLHQPGWFRTRRVWKLAVPALALAAAAVIIVATPASFWSRLWPKNTPIVKVAQAATITFEPTTGDALGVDASTGFIIAAKEGTLTAQEVEKNLSFSPKVDFSVTPQGTNAYQVKPKQALSDGTVYAASFEGQAKKADGTTKPQTYSWAYQVRQVFKIVGTLPRDQATPISPKTGIEVAFSNSGVTADQMAKHFRIEPSVSGKFEVHNKTIVFVPAESLKDKTIYTVTITKGLAPTGAEEGLSDDTTFHFEVVNEQNVGQPLALAHTFEAVRPNDPLVLNTGFFPETDYNGKKMPAASTYSFTVYRYTSLDAFSKAISDHQAKIQPWAQYANANVTYPTAGLSTVGTFKVEAKANVLMIGQGFPEGSYLAVSTSNKQTTQIPFLVSNIGTYAMTTKTETLVWVNDLATGKPIKNAAVTLAGTDVKSTTGADGITTFTTPASIAGDTPMVALATVSVGSKQALIMLRDVYDQYYSGSSTWMMSRWNPEANAFWHTLTTDRDIYKPNDTVRFWGMAKRRDQPQASEKITAQIVQDRYDQLIKSQVVASADITTTATGTYIGQLDLGGVQTGWGTSLNILIDGKTIDSQYLDIETYQTPSYQISVTPDRYVAITGDTITYRVATTFFDGTPVPHLGLRKESTTNQTSDLMTDGNGQGTITQVAADYNDSLFLQPTDVTNGEVSGGANVLVYPADFSIEAASTVKGKTATVSGIVKNIHPEKADPTAADPLAGVISEPRPNQTLTGNLIAVITTAVSDAPQYDFLSKQVITPVHYDTHEENRGTFTVTTDAKGKFSTTVTIEPKTIYRIELSGVDEKQRTTKTSIYLAIPDMYSGWTSGGFALVDMRDTRDERRQNATYAIGDSVTLAVIDGQQAPTVTKDTRFLFLGTQRGLRRHAVQSNPQFEFQFSESDVPNLNTGAVVFTGRGFEELSGPVVTFKKETRQLTITLTPDQKRYAPGSQAVITVHVTDPKGRGMQSRVNLEAVDEAVLSLTGGKTVDPLSSIYRYVGDGVVDTYISHQEIARTSLAEGGGGGGGRINFQDNALHTEIVTDDQGNGRATMNVPDNLTSWQITAQAVTDDLYAGTASKPIPVSQDLFVIPTFSDRILERDRLNVFAAAYGTALKAKQAVQFSLTIDDGTPITFSGKAFEQASVALPNLTVGDHRIRVAVAAQGQEDAVIKTMHVLDSNLEKTAAHEALLDRGEKPMLAETGRTQIRIADADRNLAYETFWNIVGVPHNRLDETVASNIAAAALTDDFKQQVWATAGDVSAFQTKTGIALYTMGSDDIEYGALAAGSVPDDLRGPLTAWLTNVINNKNSNTNEVAWALYGLAQLKQPILPDIRTLLAVPNLPDTDKLTLALALEALGAKEEARPIADALLAAFRGTQGQYVFLTIGSTTDERIVNSARLAILAAGLGLDDRYALLRYVKDNPPRDTTTNLEQALAAERLMWNVPTATDSVTYSVSGATTTKSISGAESVDLTLSAIEAKTFVVTAHSGNVSVVTSFQTPFDPKTAAVDPNLSLARRYLVNGKAATTFKRGDVVKVEFTWKKQPGELGKQFSVTDLLPSGLRLVSNPWRFADTDNSFNYPYAIENNQVKLYPWRGTFYYYAAAVQDGTSIAEPPMIQSTDVPANIQYGAEATITVR